MSLIFDSHLDLAWNAMTWRRDLRVPLAELNAAEAGMTDQPFRGRATVTLPEIRRARMAVCLGTMMGRVPYGESTLHGSTLDFPSHQQVYGFARGQLGYYDALQQVNELRFIRTGAELSAHWAEWKQASTADPARSNDLPIGMILAMEGADAIDSPEQTQRWFDDGLRCASLVHYGTSAYAVGTGCEGPLTELGRQLLKSFEAVGMILDTTHLSDQSFFEAMDCFAGPVCASHQACRAVVPGQRQFSDQQIRILIERGGVLGVPCDAWMLYPNWVRGKTSRDVVAIDVLVDHIDHICQLSGNCRHVSIGSDLDGGFGTEQTPRGLDSIADLRKLETSLEQRGYAQPDIDLVMGENWLRFFCEHLPE